MEIRADLMDAHMYAFKRLVFLQLVIFSLFFHVRCSLSSPSLSISFRSVLQEVLDEKDEFQSLQEDVLPYLVRSQLVSQINSLYTWFLFALHVGIKNLKQGQLSTFDVRNPRYYLMVYHKQKKMEMRRLVLKTTKQWYLESWPTHLLQASMNSLRVTMALLMFEESINAVLTLPARADTVNA